MGDRRVPEDAEGKPLGAIVMPEHQGIERGNLPSGERGHGFGVGHAGNTHSGRETFAGDRVAALLLRARVEKLLAMSG